MVQELREIARNVETLAHEVPAVFEADNTDPAQQVWAVASTNVGITVGTLVAGGVSAGCTAATYLLMVSFLPEERSENVGEASE